jgi:hypothetical protein
MGRGAVQPQRSSVWDPDQAGVIPGSSLPLALQFILSDSPGFKAVEAKARQPGKCSFQETDLCSLKQGTGIQANDHHSPAWGLLWWPSAQRELFCFFQSVLVLLINIPYAKELNSKLGILIILEKLNSQCEFAPSGYPLPD